MSLIWASWGLPVLPLQRFYKKAAVFVFRAVGKHSPQLAQAVVDCGALDILVMCLEDFDPGVKEAAAWALGYIARHNAGNGACFKTGLLLLGLIGYIWFCLLSHRWAFNDVSVHYEREILNDGQIYWITYKKKKKKNLCTSVSF